MSVFECGTEYELAPPPADALIEALRGVGYSLATAIADLVDNSISAGSANVWLAFWWEGRHSFISILDDGEGMDEAALSQAMRPGSINPLEQRNEQDLGRFGLGLKTASFSQCRRLTVASRNSRSPIAVRRWDLDHVARTREWQLLKREADGSTTRLRPLEEQGRGTLVLWERLDRIVGEDAVLEDSRAQDLFLASVDIAVRHLDMVFHRFLEGPAPGLRIFVNGRDERHRLRAWDPFLGHHPATERTPEEALGGRATRVTVQGFVLPHKDQLSPDEWEQGAGPAGWVAQQGFYVYRNRRLLVPGDWLGLGRGRSWTKEEPYRLARLRLDIPNSADDAWQIDIKKSRARPPPGVRLRLTDLADQVRQKARRIFAHRGSYGPRPPTPNLIRAWRTVDRKGGAAYRIDRSHPIVRQVLEDAGPLRDALEGMLRVIEETVPIQRIWLEAVEKEGIEEGGFAGADPEEVADIAEELFRYMVGTIGLSPAVARQQLLQTEPFQNFPELISALGPGPAAHGDSHE